MLRIGVRQYVLNKIVAILVAGNIDKRNTRAVNTTLTNPIQITAQKFDTANLEAFFDNFGGKLIHAILRSKANDMVDSTAAISWSSVFTNVLDAPITELTVGDNIDACKNLFNARALFDCKQEYKK
jgi:hypothetical protein